MSKDRELLDTVEGGPQHAMSLADLKEEGGLPKADRKPYRPWAYNLAKTDVCIPRLAPGKQRWFAAVTRAGTKEQLARVLVLAQDTETEQWEMVSTVDIDDPQDLPQILLDADGYWALPAVNRVVPGFPNFATAWQWTSACRSDAFVGVKTCDPPVVKLSPTAERADVIVAPLLPAGTRGVHAQGSVAPPRGITAPADPVRAAALIRSDSCSPSGSRR